MICIERKSQVRKTYHFFLGDKISVLVCRKNFSILKPLCVTIGLHHLDTLIIIFCFRTKNFTPKGMFNLLVPVNSFQKEILDPDRVGICPNFWEPEMSHEIQWKEKGHCLRSSYPKKMVIKDKLPSEYWPPPL
jgi:hypothetical protein